MAEEISFLSEELTKICGEMRKALDAVHKLKKKPEQRDEKIEFIQERMTRAKDVYSNYRMELREVLKECGRATYSQYEQAGHKHHQTITAIGQELEAFKEQANRTDLMVGADGKMQRNKNDANTWSGNEVIEKARKIQTESKASVERSTKLVSKIEQTATDTNITLKAQTDQMRTINDDVVRVDTALRRADKEIRSIARRMATDKMIMCLVLLLFLAIIG
mmetsp:Transcript_21173/g.58362  ORF Transcript_21173/g.58362 Transcript_21173/m.58362 type:complete len:220 (-) Transcript_21173:709-1368(-)